MGQSMPLTEAERERIYQARLQNKTLPEIAAELDRSVYTIRKWWRRICAEGVQGLRARKPGPVPRGILSQFEPEIAKTVLNLKRTHRRWGADRILVELSQDSQLRELRLPHRSRLFAFFQDQCPDCVAHSHPRPRPASPPPIATAAHEVWQLDNQEKIELHDGEVAVICNVRDPYGAAMIASRAFGAKTAKHWRKLDWTEIRQVLRDAAAEWHTLPDCLVTDNELVLAGSPGDPFPSRLTLWLRGIGVKHDRIRPHCPTDQPQVERGHRTLDDFTQDTDSRLDIVHLQHALDRERYLYNHVFPARASDCAGHAPLEAHPESLRPRRVYEPEWELALFDLQRVFDYLSSLVFARRVSPTGVVSLGRHLYSVGRPHAGKKVQVRCEPITHEWVYSETVQIDHQKIQQEIARRPIRGIDILALTGLTPPAAALPYPVQLTLPCLAA